MARRITQCVGLGCKLQSLDVETVQELLNGVLPAFGGPAVKLKVDGICGPKTQAAINNFQMKQFGFKGTDGRVDPNKQTMQKLNELSFGTIDPPIVPPGPLPSILPESTRFVIHRMASETSFGGLPEELFFHITDMVNGFIGIYFLQPSGQPLPTIQPPLSFKGPSRSFITKGPQTVDRMDSDAVYFSREVEGVISSDFILRLATGAIQIAMPHHLIGPNGIMSASKDGRGSGSTFISGRLVFVRPG
jgi:peptidoglycan hydrolase-like protein with peptidoglycan-binding domain